MENKKDDFNKEVLASGFTNYKEGEQTSWEWIVGLALVAGLFSDNGVWGSKKATETDLKIARLEAKTEMLEKLILK